MDKNMLQIRTGLIFGWYVISLKMSIFYLVGMRIETYAGRQLYIFQFTQCAIKKGSKYFENYFGVPYYHIKYYTISNNKYILVIIY